MKSVIVLGAGSSQMPVIQRARDLDLYVIAVDKNPMAPGRIEANDFILASTYNDSDVLAGLKSLNMNNEIVGVINRSSGIPVITAAKISEKLNIASYSEETAQTIVNKHKLMKFCAENNIPAPKSIAFSNLDELEAMEPEFPCVVRPSLSLVGKSGVFKVENRSTLIECAQKALQNSINSYALLDEYITGYDVSLISFVNNGTLIPVCILDEVNRQTPAGQIYGKGFSIPSIVTPADVQDKIIGVAKRLVQIFSIHKSAFMVSMRLARGTDPKVLEIHLDLGGDSLIEHLFPETVSPSFLDYAIQMISGDINQNIKFEVKPGAVQYSESGENSPRTVKKLGPESRSRMIREMLELGHG